MSKINKRPWQGTLLGSLLILMIVGIIIGTIVGLYVFLMAFVVSQSSKIGAQFMGIFPVVSAVSFTFVIIMTLVTKGIFSGSRLGIVTVAVSLVFEVLTYFWNILRLVFTGDFKNALFSLLGLFFLAIIVWLTIYCLKHPYYGGNGKLSWQTLKFWGRREADVDKMTTF